MYHRHKPQDGTPWENIVSAAAAPADGHGASEAKWWILAAKIFVVCLTIGIGFPFLSDSLYQMGTNLGNGIANIFIPLPRAREGIGMIVPFGINVAIMIAAIKLANSIDKDDAKVAALNKKIAELEAAAAKKAAAAPAAAAAAH